MDATPLRPRRWGDHLLAAVPLLWLGTFFIAPLCLSIVFSFGNSLFGAVQLGFSLDNYRAALSGLFLTVLLRTIVFAFFASLLCLLCAFPAACFIARHSGRRRTLLFVLVLLPYFSSFLVRVMALQILFSRGNLIDLALNAIGLPTGFLSLLETPQAVYIGMIYAYLPVAIVPLVLVLERIPKPVLEASRDLGATPWRKFLTITLPLSRPGIATAALLTFVPMLGELVIPKLLGGGRGVLIGQIISAQYLQAQNYALGSAIAVLLLIIVIAALGLLLRFSAGFMEVAG